VVTDLAQARQVQPGVVVMDPVVPDKSGLEAILQMHETHVWQDACITASSVSAFAGRWQFHQGGGDAFLPKLVQAGSLFALLGEHTGITRMYAEMEVPLPEFEEGGPALPLEGLAAPHDPACTGDLRAVQKRAMCLEEQDTVLTLDR
jgi:DNA-binding response OmpR family regulator